MRSSSSFLVGWMVVGSGVQDLVLACWFAGMLPNTAGCSVGGVAMLVLACWLGGGAGPQGVPGLVSFCWWAEPGLRVSVCSPLVSQFLKQMTVVSGVSQRWCQPASGWGWITVWMAEGPKVSQTWCCPAGGPGSGPRWSQG